MFHPDFIQAGTGESVSFTEEPQIHFLIIQKFIGVGAGDGGRWLLHQSMGKGKSPEEKIGSVMEMSTYNSFQVNHGCACKKPICTTWH